MSINILYDCFNKERDKLKNYIYTLTAILMAVFLCFTAFATGDPNIDGGGGGTDSGTGENFWSVGNDGVRVTVVRESDKRPVTTPVDFTNLQQSNINMHFGLKSKITYNNGGGLSPFTTPYNCVQPISSIPQIISSSGGSNISAVKDYFCAKTNIEYICEQTDFNFDELISGKYVIMLEPVAYFTYNSIKYAMSATEAALFDQIKNGDLKNKMGFLTHQNLPLAMFLEKPDIGYPAYSGGTSGIRANSTIISSLGIGTVRFTEGACCNHKEDCSCIIDVTKPNDCQCKEKHPDVPCSPDLPECDCESAENGGSVTDPDYEYRTNTNVITSVMLYNNSSEGINPKEPASVTFNIEGRTYTKSGIVIPPNESQLVWVQWKTPTTPKSINITVSASGGAVAEKSTIVVNIVKLEEKTPPNTEGRDRNDSYRFKPVASYGNDKSHTWNEWWAWWQPYWVWIENWEYEGGSCDCPPETPCSGDHGSWVDNGWWEDHGWWEYEFDTYFANLEVIHTKLSPDERVPTDIGSGSGIFEIKSGYGVNIDSRVKLTTNGRTGDTTTIQNVIATFPEFDYSIYNRLLISNDKDRDISNWSFANNNFSQFNNPVHFTPIWFPDRTKYDISVVSFDAWTPIGQLYASSNAYVMIEGNVYDDWYISPF